MARLDPGKLPKNVIARYAYLLVQRYFDDDVGRESAAAAYYLLFTIFPFAVFVSTFLGTLNVDIRASSPYLADIFPEQILDVLTAYLSYVSEAPSVPMLLFALVFSLYFPMRATNSLMRSIRRASDIPKPRELSRHQLKVFLYTLFIITTFVVALVFITVGSYFMSFFSSLVNIPPLFVAIWTQFRFLFLGVLLFCVLYVMYSTAGDRRAPFRSVAPGVFGSLVAWMIISVIFSFYVSHIAMYSVIYGSIGTMIVLLVWLYLSATVLIMGAEFNSVLSQLKSIHAAWKLP